MAMTSIDNMTADQVKASIENSKDNPFELGGRSFKVGKIPYAVGKKVMRVLNRNATDIAQSGAGALSDADQDALETLLYPYITFEVPGAIAGKTVLSTDTEELAFGGNPTLALEVIWRAITIGFGDFLIGSR